MSNLEITLAKSHKTFDSKTYSSHYFCVCFLLWRGGGGGGGGGGVCIDII